MCARCVWGNASTTGPWVWVVGFDTGLVQCWNLSSSSQFLIMANLKGLNKPQNPPTCHRAVAKPGMKYWSRLSLEPRPSTSFKKKARQPKTMKKSRNSPLLRPILPNSHAFCPKNFPSLFPGNRVPPPPLRPSADPPAWRQDTAPTAAPKVTTSGARPRRSAAPRRRSAESQALASRPTPADARRVSFDPLLAALKTEGRRPHFGDPTRGWG